MYAAFKNRVFSMNAIVLGDFLGSDVYSWYHLFRIDALLPDESAPMARRSKHVYLLTWETTKYTQRGLKHP